MKCFNYPMRENMMRLAIVWFTLSFGWAPSWCCLCQRKIRKAPNLWSDNSTRQSGLRSHCFSVISISLLCKNFMVSKSITVCGSILVHWCLSTSSKRGKSSERWKNTLKTFFKIKQKPEVSLCLLSVYLSVFLPDLSLKTESSYSWSLVLLVHGYITTWRDVFPYICRYYGLSVWFPDVIKHLQADEYASKVKIHSDERIEDFTFNFTLENQIHKNGLFINDR